MSLHPKLDKFAHPKRVRSSMDQVTGEMSHVILDPIQLAAERVRNVIEAEAMRLGIEDARRMKDKVAGFLAAMYPHCDSDLARDPVNALVMVLSRRLAICAELLSKCAERGK